MKEWVNKLEPEGLNINMDSNPFDMANKKSTNNIPKISRQLILFHIFICSKIIEINEITNLINISNKTIQRDLHQLQSAGLLRIKFSKKENGYIHLDDNKRCPFSEPAFSENKAENIHLEKLIRLATIMIEFREYQYNNQETCSSWYKNKFPKVSRKTMQRDFIELNQIGYEIQYDRSEKCYQVSFPEGLDAIECRIGELQGR